MAGISATTVPREADASLIEQRRPSEDEDKTVGQPELSDLEHTADDAPPVAKIHRLLGGVRNRRTQAKGENTAAEQDASAGFDPRDMRSAARALTRHTMAREEPKLLQERDELLSKKFEGGLSPREERHLKYVRWQLDRIDDAVNGAHLDQVERIVAAQEDMALLVREYAAMFEKLTQKTSEPTAPVAPPDRVRHRG
jgi:hypothetical protein